MTQSAEVHRPDALPAQRAEFLNQIVTELYKRTSKRPQHRQTRLGRLIVVEEPELVGEVFHRYDDFQKNFALIAAIGKSRFNTNGDDWHSFRQRTQPYYSRAGRLSNLDLVNGYYEEELEKANPTNATELQHAFLSGAIRAFFAAFGLNPDATEYFRHFDAMRQLFIDLQFYSWTGMPPPDTRETLQFRIQNVAQEFWETCEKDRAVADFLVSLSDTSGRAEMLDTVTDFMTNLFAGIETTSATLSWFANCIGQNEEVQERCRTCLDDGYHGPDYVKTFLHETMRCFPPIPFVTRQVAKDVSLGGYQLAKGQQLMISLVGMHRWPETWDRASEFLSARPEFLNQPSLPVAFRPFLSGPRVCGGRRLAELELTAATRLILRKYRLTNSEQGMRFQYALALRPMSSSEMKVQKL